MLHLTVILSFLSNYLDTFLKKHDHISFFPSELFFYISQVEKQSKLTEILYLLVIQVLKKEELKF